LAVGSGGALARNLLGALATALGNVATLSVVMNSASPILAEYSSVIRKLKTGKYRLYSRKTDPSTGKRRNLGTFEDRAAAEKHEREVQYFKRH
jgi:hypothetical protein